jgi:Uncharacterized protein conserved in bacteria
MIEIERKFLVEGDFRPFAVRKIAIVQGYLCVNPGQATVRVRLKGDSAYLTIKGPGNENGFSRMEFEYEIPLEDGKELLKLSKQLIEKERFLIPVGNHTYEVDVFHGRHEGLVIAELELNSESESFEKPDWLGEEVTGDIRYYNAYLASH